MIQIIKVTLYTLSRYELAWKMNRGSNDVLWWAIIGHTSLYLHKKMENDRYLKRVPGDTWQYLTTGTSWTMATCRTT